MGDFLSNILYNNFSKVYFENQGRGIRELKKLLKAMLLIVLLCVFVTTPKKAFSEGEDEDYIVPYSVPITEESNNDEGKASESQVLDEAIGSVENF